MTDIELKEFLKDNPTLFHMAEFGSWPSIKERGLLSTSAILDLYGVKGDKRRQIEVTRRPTSVVVTHETLPPITIRDQMPMTDEALRGCLLDGLQPTDWYSLLNNRVFFWPSKGRLLRLLGARAYRDKKHDILEINAESLFDNYQKKIALSPINSGATLFNPQPRGKRTFSRIANYPYSDRPKNNRMAEIAVDRSVPDIAKYVVRVSQMQGATEICELPV